MHPIGELDAAADASSPPRGPSISWDTSDLSTADSFRSFDDGAVGSVYSTGRVSEMAGATSASPGAARVLRRLIDRCCAGLSRPTFGQIHGRSPMETTRIVWMSSADAADALGRSGVVEWGRGRRAGRLRLGAFRTESDELGRPWVADAILRGYRIRHLRVSVAIIRYGKERCGIQIRPAYRRPWSSRRLRRCLRSSHDAADCLGELALAVDFMPPQHDARDILSA